MNKLLIFLLAFSVLFGCGRFKKASVEKQNGRVFIEPSGSGCNLLDFNSLTIVCEVFTMDPSTGNPIAYSNGKYAKGDLKSTVPGGTPNYFEPQLPLEGHFSVKLTIIGPCDNEKKCCNFPLCEPNELGKPIFSGTSGAQQYADGAVSVPVKLLFCDCPC